MAFKYAVALTGSIATGKSTVSKIFSSLGYTIIDADRIAHQVLDAVSEKVAEMFGEDLVKEGRVDRKALGTIVFSDPKKRRALESMLHPLIFVEIERLSIQEDSLSKPYLVDIPLFFEGGHYPIEHTLVVCTTPEQQLKWLMKRNGYSQEEARNRIATQIPVEEKRQNATYVIDNSATLTHLKEECIRVDKEIIKDFT